MRIIITRRIRKTSPAVRCSWKFAISRYVKNTARFPSTFAKAKSSVLADCWISGKSHLGKGIAGLIPPDIGTVRLAGKAPNRPEFRDLIAGGLAYVPSERLLEGIIAPFSVAWNTSLAGGEDIFSSRLGFWRGALEDRLTRRYMAELAIKAPSPRSSCATLSGGNQQKVVLAKWLCRSPRIIILDNPTRGIDAGAKEEVYKLVRQLTASGACVILITDELLELIGLSNRIAIMRGGRLSAIVDAPSSRKPSEQELVSLMLGGSTLH